MRGKRVKAHPRFARGIGGGSPLLIGAGESHSMIDIYVEFKDRYQLTRSKKLF